jgi:hypothetical protein
MLERDGYVLNRERMHGETGVDIIARKGIDEIHIEVIGYKASGPARAKDFYECFFRTVSRIKDGAKRCVMALHRQAECGLPARARQYGEAWKRIGIAFPELEVWSVDLEAESYEIRTWGEWLLK